MTSLPGLELGPLTVPSETLRRTVGQARGLARRRGHELTRVQWKLGSRYVGGLAWSYCKRCGASLVVVGGLPRGKRIGGSATSRSCGRSEVGAGRGGGG